MVKTSDFESENSGSSPGEAAKWLPTEAGCCSYCKDPDKCVDGCLTQRKTPVSISLFDVDFEEANRLLAPHSTILRDLIANAIAVERERCAQMAENFNAAGKPIAKAIRQSPS